MKRAPRDLPRALGLSPYDHNLRNVPQQFPAGRALNRLPGEWVGIELLDHDCDRYLSPVGQHALIVDVPTTVCQRLRGLGVAAAGFKRR